MTWQLFTCLFAVSMWAWRYSPRFFAVVHKRPSFLRCRGAKGLVKWHRLLDETCIVSTPSGTHSAHLQTYTVFPCVRSYPGRPALHLSVSTLCANTRHRINRAARVRAPSAETDRVYRSSPFPVLLCGFCSPNTPHTYVHPLSISTPQNDCPYPLVQIPFVRLIDYPIP